MVRHIALIAAIVVSSSPVRYVRSGGDHNRCRADAERLCASIERGHGRILECLAGREGQAQRRLPKSGGESQKVTGLG